MAPRRSTIEQLAADTARSNDPQAALRALAALRHELEGLEPLLVSRALSAGASWSAIARSLGVSKQAAHRKHRHLAFQIIPPGTEPRVQVSDDARHAVQYAREEARQLGIPAIGTEHLLLGILRCEETPAVQALARLGVSHERAVAVLQPTMTSDENGGAGPATGVTDHARRILDGAVLEATRRGHTQLGVEHLLLALLADTRNGAVQTLEALRVSPGQVRRQLEAAPASA